MLKATLLALVLLALGPVSALAAPPPAAVVKANVHAATSLALAKLEQVATAGDAATLHLEAGMVQLDAAEGLGASMGWGQDYWDAVEPAVTAQIVTHFQAAFRALEGFEPEAPGLTWGKLVAIRDTVRAHFVAMRRVVSGAQATALELRTVAEALGHELGAIVDDPIATDPKVRLARARRTLKAGIVALSADLAGQPALAQQVTPHLEALKKIDGNLAEAIVEAALPHAQAIEHAQ